jgi:hypothetical protein
MTVNRLTKRHRIHHHCERYLDLCGQLTNCVYQVLAGIIVGFEVVSVGYHNDGSGQEAGEPV